MQLKVGPNRSIRSNQARPPPPGFISVYEITLHEGLRYPLVPRFLASFKACSFTSDFTTWDPSKNWSSSFIFVKNEWGLQKRWGRLKELPNCPHIGEEI
ncbi:hypothetical protein IEQ34_006629 [Dendrobium chrysotoxum]|uniref:Uncharacterized protein n=1 Tax=Dendrobium chrysotoxum TaxID=161865 RepID=A0AAV7H780_DENCH|nr:hypothetical protein IEQ34_006629 [Dendrobium chrysotoxum]